MKEQDLLRIKQLLAEAEGDPNLSVLEFLLAELWADYQRLAIECAILKQGRIQCK